MPERWRRDRFRCLQLLHLGCRPVSNKFKPPRQGANMLPNFILVCDGRTIVMRETPAQAELGRGTLKRRAVDKLHSQNANERRNRKLSTERCAPPRLSWRRALILTLCR